jgi:hypothetical protein
MSKVFVDISMSLDRFIAGQNGGPQNPLAMRVTGFISGCTKSRVGASDKALPVARSTKTMRSSRSHLSAAELT